ncbi:MAG: hypothetical protein CSA47_01610 [Gammaproteobacteria bacterium]|nr:MAG: hypothetical protein CSA47_01610 [Gammaproteobacteria bacterium]
MNAAADFGVMCKKQMKYNILFLGLFFLLTGVAFLFLENIFFQYIDKDGLIYESFFLPLGVLALIIGSLLLFTLILKKIWQSLPTKNRESN